MKSVYLQRITKKNADKGYEKTKPIQTQFLQRPKMNESLFATKDYENICNWTLGENKPKQTQFYLPPGEPALLALRFVRRSFSEDGSFSEGGSAACPEYNRRAEGGLAMIFLGAFLQRVSARPGKTLTL